MAQDQKAGKQARDPYAQRGKTLASTVQRLRGWIGSDPSRTPELVDALVQLTAHRLLGHGYAGAAADAQEAARGAAQLLTANGPVGPYTSVADANRYVTAVVQLAAVQAGMGLPDAAGRTIASLEESRQQFLQLGIEVELAPQSAFWALSCSARAALASGDAATANAYADAALTRLAGSGLIDDPDAAYLAIDAERLASDARWAAGHAEQALEYLHAARDRYETMVGGRLAQPARLSPALVERLAEPLDGIYRDLADRLAASGEVDLGLVTRRVLVERLRELTGRLGDPARGKLASALADLAGDLLVADRVDEADAAATEAAATVPDGPSVGSTALVWVSAVRARVMTRAGRSDEAVAMLRQVLPTKPAESPSAVSAVGLLALAEALAADGDVDAAASAERAFSDLARDLVGSRAAGLPARTAVQDLARGVVSRGPEQLEWAPLPPTAWFATTAAAAAGYQPAEVSSVVAEGRETADWLETERAEAHRLELARQAQARIEAHRQEAERTEAERAAAEQLAAERAQAERAQQLEVQRQAAAEEAERLERRRRREERLEAHRLEAERSEAERREAERVEAERRAAERLAADPAEAERLELERLQAELAELERLEGLAEAERLVAERAEAERAAAAQQAEAEQLAAEQAETERAAAEQAEAERAAAEQAEAEQLAAEQAETERLAAEQAEAERLAAEQAEAERLAAEQAEGERLAAEQAEAERAAAEQAAAERTRAARTEAQSPEPDRGETEADELALSQQAWGDAKARGDRRGARLANERVVELLRRRAETDLAAYGPQLQQALEELSSARLRSGDVWGSRAPAREAKALAKRLG